MKMERSGENWGVALWTPAALARPASTPRSIPTATDS
jgi:hypothetical protein